MRVLAALALAALATGAVAEPIAITSHSLAYFSRSAPAQTEFGPLTFRGGLVMTSPAPDFGGFSGLRVTDEGTLVAVSDRAHWLTGTLTYDGTKLSGLADAEMVPVLGARGKKLAGTLLGDTEGLEIDGTAAFVSIERKSQILRFDISKGVEKARAAATPRAKGFADLPYNEGLEALGIVPGGGEKGTLLVMSEAGLDEEGNHRGWLLAGNTRRPPRALSVKRRDGYSLTDLTFLPVSGDLVILERRYRPPFGLHMRLRRIQQADIADGAVLDGEILIEASLTDEIDNMEGISAHRGPDGASVLTIISDNNFGGFQRNLLLQFAVAD
jgi:hypothetical protein